MKVLARLLLIGLSVQFGFAQQGAEPSANPTSPAPSSASLEHTSLAIPNVPVPLLAKDHPVDWWFVFKFNSAAFPGCAAGASRVYSVAMAAVHIV